MTDETLMRAQSLRRHMDDIGYYLKQLDKAMAIIQERENEKEPPHSTGIRITVEGMSQSVVLPIGIDKAPGIKNLIAGIREQVVKDLEAAKTEFENL